MTNSKSIPGCTIRYAATDFELSDFDNAQWEAAQPVVIERYWSGLKAPEGRTAEVRLVWSKQTLYVRFSMKRRDPMVVSTNPDLSEKTIGLWDRDVCEVFIAPEPEHFRRYFEFDAAPTGEWVDLEIHQKPDERLTDWNYISGMKTQSRILESGIVTCIAIPFRSLGKTPATGDVWLGNLFRAVGEGETRGYLAWSPTETPVPNFHVPEKFGEFKFV